MTLCIWYDLRTWDHHIRWRRRRGRWYR